MQSPHTEPRVLSMPKPASTAPAVIIAPSAHFPKPKTDNPVVALMSTARSAPKPVPKPPAPPPNARRIINSRAGLPGGRLASVALSSPSPVQRPSSAPGLQAAESLHALPVWSGQTSQHAPAAYQSAVSRMQHAQAQSLVQPQHMQDASIGDPMSANMQALESQHHIHRAHHNQPAAQHLWLQPQYAQGQAGTSPHSMQHCWPYYSSPGVHSAPQSQHPYPYHQQQQQQQQPGQSNDMQQPSLLAYGHLADRSAYQLPSYRQQHSGPAQQHLSGSSAQPAAAHHPQQPAIHRAHAWQQQPAAHADVQAQFSAASAHAQPQQPYYAPAPPGSRVQSQQYAGMAHPVVDPSRHQAPAASNTFQHATSPVVASPPAWHPLWAGLRPSATSHLSESSNFHPHQHANSLPHWDAPFSSQPLGVPHGGAGPVQPPSCDQQQNANGQHQAGVPHGAASPEQLQQSSAGATVHACAAQSGWHGLQHAPQAAASTHEGGAVLYQGRPCTSKQPQKCRSTHCIMTKMHARVCDSPGFAAKDIMPEAFLQQQTLAWFAAVLRGLSCCLLSVNVHCR